MKPYRDLIDAICNLFPQVVFRFAEDGVDMQAMDSTHVALGELYMPPETFVSYDYDGDEGKEDDNVEIGLDLGSLNTILKCVSGDSVCEMKYDEGEGDCLMLKFSSEHETFEYELRLLDISGTDVEIPSRDEDACVVLSAAVYQKFTKDVAALGTDLTIHVKEDEITFLTSSDSGKGTWTLEYGNPKAGGVGMEDFVNEIKQQFAIRFLQQFTKSVTISKQAEVALKKSEPIEVCCALPKMSLCTILPPEEEDGNEGEDAYPWGQIKFYLAPKIMEAE